MIPLKPGHLPPARLRPGRAVKIAEADEPEFDEEDWDNDEAALQRGYGSRQVKATPAAMLQKAAPPVQATFAGKSFSELLGGPQSPPAPPAPSDAPAAVLAAPPR